ncbi:MAG: TonB-dependent receptor [Ignavibacteria bacterium]|nr:TonB-dependent receptor [Ignavibacteria bacterium]
MRIWYLIITIIIINVFYVKPNETSAISDNATISGFVYDANSKENLVGATIFLEGTKFGALTNKNGFFALNNIPPGKYRIVVSYVGYEKYVDTIVLKKKDVARKNFYLKPVDVSIEEVSVVAEKEIERREITISKVTVPVQQISKIRVGGESDLFRSLQYLPGILTSSQISSGLFVRGGSPDQNLVLLDNMTVYNPSHLFGFISTFNTEAIKDVELIKGGFPAEFGGRISSVLNVTQKEGNREKVTGGAGIGLISSKAMLEGPLFNGSWFIAGRRTYIDIIKNFLPSDPTLPLPNFWFYDINAKVTQDLDKDNKIYFGGFLSQDLFSYSGFGIDFDVSIKNQASYARWIHILFDNIFTSTSLSLNYYQNGFVGKTGDYVYKIENSIRDINFKTNFDWFLTELLTLKFGYEVSNFRFKYIQNFAGTETDTSQNSGVTPAGILNITVDDWNHSGFFQMNYNFTELLAFQLGGRINYWSLSKSLSFDPRLAIKYNFSDKLSAKFAWGIFHQNIRLATQPDFSFFDTWLPTDTTVPAINSQHFIFSIESEPFEGINFNFDIYYKTLRNITELNLNVITAKNSRDVFYVGNGRSFGAEIFFQKKFGKFVGWFGYALGYIYARFDSLNYGREFRPKYDRRHDFKIVVQYLLNKRWEFSATFTFQSGQSYTGATSMLISRLPEQSEGLGKVITSQRYGLRLPPSHQLNISATYNFHTFGLQSKLILDIYNVYNRRDIWFRYYNLNEEVPRVEDVRLLPIIPTISYEIKF